MPNGYLFVGQSRNNNLKYCLSVYSIGIGLRNACPG